MEEEDESEYMESRRVADLEEFQGNNPIYQWPEIDEIQVGQNLVSPVVPSSTKTKRLRKPNKGRKAIVWSLERTLELLEAMKVFVRENKLKCLGSDIKKWQAIATHLPNPLGLELQKYARSCEVRFQNLRRKDKTAFGIEIKLKESMDEYFWICNQNTSRPSGSSSKK